MSIFSICLFVISVLRVLCHSKSMLRRIEIHNQILSIRNRSCSRFWSSFAFTHALSISVCRYLSASKWDALYRPYELAPLSEKDLQEKFIRGWGPGGQKINKVRAIKFLRVLWVLFGMCDI